MSHNRTPFLLVSLALLSVGPDAWAQTSPTVSPAGLAPGASDADRYRWLDGELAKIEVPTRRWFGNWAWTYALLATADYQVAAVTQDSTQRTVAVVGAAGAFLGFMGVLTQPNSLSGARDGMAHMNASTALGQYERRRKAEYVLHAVAAEERYWRSPVPHLLAAGVNAGATAVLTAGYHLAGYGVLNAVLGMTIAEIQIWTRPTLATQSWRRYVDAEHPTPPSEVGPDQVEQFSVSLVALPGGIGARGSF